MTSKALTPATPASRSAALAALARRDLGAFLAPETDRYGQAVVLSDGAPKGTQQGCWDRMGVFGRHGGRVELAAHLKEADAWIVRYGTRRPVPVAAPPAPAAAKPAPSAPAYVAAPASAPSAAPAAKPAPVLPPPPPAVDHRAVKSALALVAGCATAADLDAAAELLNAEWPEGWPRSVEMKWDAAFRKVA